MVAAVGGHRPLATVVGHQRLGIINGGGGWVVNNGG